MRKRATNLDAFKSHLESLFVAAKVHHRLVSRGRITREGWYLHVALGDIVAPPRVTVFCPTAQLPALTAALTTAGVAFAPPVLLDEDLGAAIRVTVP